MCWHADFFSQKLSLLTDSLTTFEPDFADKLVVFEPFWAINIRYFNILNMSIRHKKF
jgi:hypothetical protein